MALRGTPAGRFTFFQLFSCEGVTRAAAARFAALAPLLAVLRCVVLGVRVEGEGVRGAV
ncbi:hypothetical protein GCM10025871_02160 [Deinococcus metallilatus]|nr:hypothetical protein GCM10025871_02160 [Deinococcus metallilatus]